MTRVIYKSTKRPTQQILNSGSSATYTTPTGCTRIRVRGIGGGGGCGNTGGGQTAGGTTSFSASTMSATGGAAGTGAAGSSAAGGAGTNGTWNYTGGMGVGCFTGTGFFPAGCSYPGCNFMYPTMLNSTVAPANSGQGATDNARNFVSSASTNGSGGGGGGFERFIDQPAATYTYTIGAGGTAGTGGFAGGSGQIIVDEFYD